MSALGLHPAYASPDVDPAPLRFGVVVPTEDHPETRAEEELDRVAHHGQHEEVAQEGPRGVQAGREGLVPLRGFRGACPRRPLPRASGRAQPAEEPAEPPRPAPSRRGLLLEAVRDVAELAPRYELALLLERRKPFGRRHPLLRDPRPRLPPYLPPPAERPDPPNPARLDEDADGRHDDHGQRERGTGREGPGRGEQVETRRRRVVRRREEGRAESVHVHHRPAPSHASHPRHVMAVVHVIHVAAHVVLRRGHPLRRLRLATTRAFPASVGGHDRTGVPSTERPSMGVDRWGVQHHAPCGAERCPAHFILFNFK
mmetsp:Transcript_6436/g.14553  ORF Transcript_6436/g.14553 Transcript_6436/m.14553 type:complete len:314 (-) Transcript_6436:329-1270(-)